jgi:hypothetical protein
MDRIADQHDPAHMPVAIEHHALKRAIDHAFIIGDLLGQCLNGGRGASLPRMAAAILLGIPRIVRFGRGDIYIRSALIGTKPTPVGPL